MMLKLKLAIVCLCVAMILPALPALRAQATGEAPIPPQILTAKKIFISNAGGRLLDDYRNDRKSETYDQFYMAVKNWGHFQLVSSPSEADLIFQVELNPITPDNSSPVQVQLELRDPKTNVLIWTIDERVGHWTGSPIEKDLTKTIDKLIDDLKALTSAPAK